MYCSEDLPVLYGLYKYAESLKTYQFNLSQLTNLDRYAEAISPAIIMGIDDETFKNIISGLSSKYPDYINASFTFELNNIVLKENHTSEDVLTLLR